MFPVEACNIDDLFGCITTGITNLSFPVKIIDISMKHHTLVECTQGKCNTSEPLRNGTCISWQTKKQTETPTSCANVSPPPLRTLSCNTNGPPTLRCRNCKAWPSPFNQSLEDNRDRRKFSKYSHDGWNEKTKQNKTKQKQTNKQKTITNFYWSIITGKIVLWGKPVRGKWTLKTTLPKRSYTPK